MRMFIYMWVSSLFVNWGIAISTVIPSYRAIY